jgi:hypothetical protein
MELATTVNSELAPPKPGVTDDGAKEQLQLEGNPEHDRSTVESNEPAPGDIRTVTLPFPPDAISRDAGVVAIVSPPPTADPPLQLKVT